MRVLFTIIVVFILLMPFAGSGSDALPAAELGVSVNATNRSLCPLCPAIGAQTISEGLTTMDVGVFARLAEKRETPADDEANARFEIVEVLFGETFLSQDQTIELDYYGSSETGTEFLLAAIDPLNLTWNDPIRMSPQGKQYVRDVQGLSQGANDRLRFFHSRLEDPDVVIASDAYDEFARAPYDTVLAISDAYDRGQLLSWIRSEDVPATRKRLYFMLLGICGTVEDVPDLREIVLASVENRQTGVDSMIACYLSLAGESGLDWVEQTFLIDEAIGYSPTYSAIMALRFHGTDADTIPRDRIIQSMRLLLDRPTMADLVIPDLARWEDWDSAQQLYQLFINVEPEHQFVRVPIVIYMRLCPLPEAAGYLEEFEELDPSAIEKANLNFIFGGQ